MKPEQLEKTQEELLEDLTVLEEHKDEIGTPLVLIGGWAVASYTRSVRRTRDADFVASKRAVNPLMSLLRQLGYDCQNKRDKISANKRVNGDDIKLTIHVAIDGVFDLITRSRYALTDEELKQAERRKLKPFFSTLNAPEMLVARVEDLFLMKLRPFRDQDMIDVCLLLLEAYAEFDLKHLKTKIAADELPDLYHDRFAQLADRIRAGDLRIEWRRQLNRTLTAREEQAILTKLRTIAKR
jgi:hypothetical protein